VLVYTLLGTRVHTEAERGNTVKAEIKDDNKAPLTQHTRIPNFIMDVQMRRMTGAELKVLLAVLRYTLGWNKARDRISVGQIMELTGLSRSMVQIALKSLRDNFFLRASGAERSIKTYQPVASNAEREALKAHVITTTPGYVAPDGAEEWLT